MSYSLDANLLLYASDRSSDRCERARRFVQTCAAGPEILCLTWPTLMAYIRIATHPRIFAAPLSPDEALGNVAALVGLPHVRVVSASGHSIRMTVPSGGSNRSTCATRSLERQALGLPVRIVAQ